jgi:hypothetical protein
MTHPLTDPTSLAVGLGDLTSASLGGLLGALAGASPLAVITYLVVRQLILVVVVVWMTRGATPAQRITLARDYLAGITHGHRRDQARPWGRRRTERGNPAAGGG